MMGGGAAGGLEFRLLGPLEVLRDGTPLRLGGTRQRALLALLLVHANEVVSSDRIIDELLGGQASDATKNAVQAAISRLRRVLEGSDDGQVIVTRSPGYALQVAPEQVDLFNFERLLAKGREALAEGNPRKAADVLREAVALWRGPPLSDLGAHEFAEREMRRLDELRLQVITARIEADLSLGQHAELIGELESLVDEHPAEERLRAQLMLALYRSGRQAEALEAYRKGRRVLVDELGIEPGRPLRDLEQAILEQSPGLDLDRVAEPPRPDSAVDRPAEVSPKGGPEQRDRLGRKTVTVVHVRITASSASGDALDPEIMRLVLSRALQEITTAIEWHEGALAVVAADSVSALFGMPIVHEDDASRAMRAAGEIRDRLAEVARDLERESTGRVETRMGVSTGEVMTGDWPDSPVGATGPPLTTAAALAHSAEPDTIVADDATRRAASLRRDDGRFTSPMVGRARERRRLHDVLEQAVGDRSCQLFTILGAAGVGKSRLVREFLQDIEETALVARGRCLPYGEGITYWPVVEAIKDLIGADSGPEVSSTEIAALIEDADDATLVARRVSEAIGLAETTVGVEEGFEALREFLEALAARRPLVVVFDDVHWGEPTFHDLVEHLADWSRGEPIFLLCVARPELLDVRTTWGGGKLNATSVLLEPLSDDECTELLANLVGEAELADEVDARIAAAAEGNPLFVEEMLSMLIDDEVLVRRADTWVATRELAAVPVPPTIQALLAARLDQLSVDERVAIEAAAVEGKVFHQGSVALLAPDIDVPSAVGSLVRKELVRPDRPVFATERAFRFRHLMIRDAAYDAIAKEVRARLHERHAAWLGERVSDRALEFEEILGYHLEQAFHYRTELGLVDDSTRELGRAAAARLGAAGKRAFVRRDAQAAVTLLSRSAVLLPADDPARVELVPNVRVVQGFQGDLAWADRVLTEAVGAAAAEGNDVLESHALVQRGFLRLFTQPDVTPTDLLRLAGRAIATFERARDELGLARAWRLMAQAHYLERRAGLSVEASERALEHARRSGDLLERREFVEWLCVGLMLGPTPASKAAQRCEQLLDDVHEDPILEPTVISVLGNLRAMLGQMDEAEALFARFRDAVHRLEETIWLFAINFGFIALADDPVAEEGELRPGYEALRTIGEKSHFSSVTALLARTLYAQGRYDEAYRLTLESEEAARPNDIHSHILWRATRAKVLARRGEFEAAEALAREAVAFAGESDFLDPHGDTLMDLAEVLLIADRAEEASPAVEAALQLYERKENVVSAERARARLAVRPAKA